jgi:hypothetical protein
VITRLEVWEARRTLGVRPAPDGNYQKEGEFLMNKAIKYASRLAASNLSVMDVFIFHRSTYVPSMTYSLPVTTFEPKVLNKSQSRAIQAILNKLGVSKSFPCRVAFGPKDMCGMALLDMSVDQGVRQVQHFIDHVFSKDSVGNLMVIALRSLQLESGCGFHLLECPSEWVPYITDCWVTCIRDFLDRSKMTIKVASARHVQPSREHDRFIMDEFRRLGLYNNQQLFDLNAVRLHLQVTTLSDIADAQGKKITKEVFAGMKPTDRYSKLKWPRQPVMTTKQRNLSKAALEAAFAPSGRAMTKRLGKWTGPPTQVWRSFYDPQMNQIVTSATGPVTRFTAYVVRTRTRHHVDATPSVTVLRYTSLDDVNWNVMVPAMEQRTPTGNVMATFHECVEESQDEEGKAHTFREYTKKLPEHERRLLWHFEFTPGGARILKSCLERNMILKLGTDGSFHQEKETASFGWVLLGNQTLLVRGAGPVDGVPSMMS